MAKPQKISLDTQERIRVLFERYSENFGLYGPQLAGMFLCPLCLRAYPLDAIPWGHLSLAHVVPKAYGGKICTLLCKDCNNGLGAGIEGEASKRKKVFDPLTGRGEGMARFNLTFTTANGEEITLPAYLRGHPSSRTLQIQINDKRCPPAEFEKSLNAMKGEFSTNGMKITLEDPARYRNDIANLVDYSIAYHALFFLMGYEFALSPLGWAMREKLCAPEEQSELVTCYRRFGAEEVKRRTPGSVVDVDGVLGVVMPDIAPFEAGRVLLIGSLIGPLDPDSFADGDKRPRHVRGMPFRVDERNLAVLHSDRGIYHRALHGVNCPFQFTIIASDDPAGEN